jgi:transposase
LLANHDHLFYIEQLERENCQLRQDNFLLTSALQKATAILKQNSKNSSKPPSSDQKKNPEKTLPSRKKGPPFGHLAHHRKNVPEDAVDHTQVCTRERCQRCGSHNIVQLGEGRVHQQVELVDMKRKVTNYHLTRYRCLDCKKRGEALLPEGISHSSFGPQLKATMAMLVGRYHLSHRETTDLLAMLCGVRASVGMISKIEKQSNEVLATTYESMLQEFQANTSSAMYSDETGWCYQHRKIWLWIASDKTTTVYAFNQSRSRAAFEKLSAITADRCLVSDRYSAYTKHEGPHQYCLSHIKREFQALAERSDFIGWCGKHLVTRLKVIFTLEREHKSGKLATASWKRRSQYQFRRIQDFLSDAYWMARGRSPLEGKLSGLCRDSPLFSTYLYEDCEPTNNLAERALRRFVIWRKKCFGSQSAGGLNFACYMMSAWMTFRQRGRDFFQSLVVGFRHREGNLAPIDLLAT